MVASNSNRQNVWYAAADPLAVPVFKRVQLDIVRPSGVGQAFHVRWFIAASGSTR